MQYQKKSSPGPGFNGSRAVGHRLIFKRPLLASTFFDPRVTLFKATLPFQCS
jgi:hypothetical protein